MENTKLKLALKYFLFICISLLCSSLIFSQDSLPPFPDIDENLDLLQPYKKYYFEGVNFVEENKELVIIVKEPRTQFAREFGHKIYSDTAFLGSLQRDLYTVINPNRVEEEIIEMCGYDIYFYIKSGTNLKLFKTLNSNCGFRDTHCSFLDRFNENGEQLKLDTLKFLSNKNRFQSRFFNEDYIYGCTITLEENFDLWQDYNPVSECYQDIRNADNRRTWMYDGKLELTLDVDTSKSMMDNLHLFFKDRGIDSIETKNINFHLKNDFDVIDLWRSDMPLMPRKKKVSIVLYINKEYFSAFSDYDILPAHSFSRKNIQLHEKEPFLLIHQ